MTLFLEGKEVDTQRPHILKVPTTFLVADLGRLDAIVSYDWLAHNDFLVNCKRHGICYLGDKVGFMLWFPGVRTQKKVALSHVKGTRFPSLEIDDTCSQRFPSLEIVDTILQFPSIEIDDTG